MDDLERRNPKPENVYTVHAAREGRPEKSGRRIRLEIIVIITSFFIYSLG